MKWNSKNVLYAAARRLLRPVALLVMRCGMTWREFAALSKSVFVEVATGEFGISGRPTNISRVSILTGISRKEVKRQRDLLAEDYVPAQGRTTDATRVLSGWFQDPLYVDESGAPKLLSRSGDEQSFESLCAAYAGDIAPATMRKELLKTGTIVENDDGQLKAIRRYFQTSLHDDENLRWAFSFIKDLGCTMDNNVFADDLLSTRFARMAENQYLPRDKVSEFSAFLNEHGQGFLERVDNWLAANAVDPSTEKADVLRVGAGLFAIEEEIQRED